MANLGATSDFAQMIRDIEDQKMTRICQGMCTLPKAEGALTRLSTHVVVAVVWALYDHCITLGQEVEFIWVSNVQCSCTSATHPSLF